jgi:hypothetical protein
MAPGPDAAAPPVAATAPVVPETTNALTAQIERASETARTLLAAADIIVTDVSDGIAAPVVADQPLVRNAAFVSAQRLAAGAPAANPAFAPGTAIAVLPSVEAPKDDLIALVALSNAQPGSSSSASISARASEPSLAQDLNRVRDDLAQQTQLEHWTAGSIAVGSFGLTVGYVLWLLRGGALLASLLSSMPAWRLLDPLPVLGRVEDEEAEDDEDDMLISSHEVRA